MPSTGGGGVLSPRITLADYENSLAVMTKSSWDTELITRWGTSVATLRGKPDRG